jgi:hypothetical protein
VFGECCCYCAGGSPVYVHTAAHPLGPYTTQNNIGAGQPGRVPLDQRRSKQAALLSHGERQPVARVAAVDTIPAQQTDVTAYQSGAGVQFLWRGDRWQSAPDRIKAHDFTYWGALHFGADGNVTALQWQDSISIEVRV